MLLSPFLQIAEKTITGILFAAVCTLAAHYFGQPEIFDPLIMVVVILTAFIFRHDKNLLSLLAIIAIAKIIEEVTWLLFDNTYQVKIPLYLFMLVIIPFFSHGWLKVYLFSFVGFAIGAEIWWYVTDYPAPGVFWQVWMSVLAAICLRAMTVRVSWMIDLTGSSKIDFLKLDEHLFNAFAFLILYYSLIAAEYYVRHMFGFHNVTFIYYASDYLGGIASSFVSYVVVIESIKQSNKSKLPA